MNKAVKISLVMFVLWIIYSETKARVFGISASPLEIAAANGITYIFGSFLVYVYLPIVVFKKIKKALFSQDLVTASAGVPQQLDWEADNSG